MPTDRPKRGDRFKVAIIKTGINAGLDDDEPNEPSGGVKKRYELILTFNFLAFFDNRIPKTVG